MQEWIHKMIDSSMVVSFRGANDAGISNNSADSFCVPSILPFPLFRRPALENWPSRHSGSFLELATPASAFDSPCWPCIC